MNYLIMHETVSPHDAIGNDIEAMYNILSECGDCYVYAHTCANRNVQYLPDDAVESYISQKDLLVIYHHSVYWKRGYELLKLVQGRIVFRYHNITPAFFFEGISQPHAELCRAGREQTVTFQKEFPGSLWMPDSDYNAHDLWLVPKNSIRILAPFNKLESWGVKEADEDIRKMIADGADYNLLFVGRLVPNKGHFFLLEILKDYCRCYGNRIKLRIIGKKEEVLSIYWKKLEQEIADLNLTENVEFIGEVTDRTLIAYYQGSDAFLCCSFHEGFCVPIVEAQYFGLPVVALRYCAVPETIGPDQLLFGPEVRVFTAALGVLKKRQDIKDFLIEKGYENYRNRFSFDVIRKKFLENIEYALTGSLEKDNMKCSRRIAFVSPWYGERVPGGAEMELREIVNRLSQAGVDVEVLTTRVRQFGASWSKDYYPRCTEMISGIPVTRFSVKWRNAGKFNDINEKVIKGQPVSAEEELAFCEEMVNSSELYEYIHNHYYEYDLFVFIPYMFGTTFYGMKAAHGKAVLIPCLHEEPYAHMHIIKSMFESAAGVIYNAYPEYELANRLYKLDNSVQEVIGISMNTNLEYLADRFREKYHILSPFILYAGRKDAGKGIDQLITFFEEYRKKSPSDIKLVLIGGGTVSVSKPLKKDVIDLGFVDTQDKYDACAAALCLCQMSEHESFSLVIMESWLCGRPVIVSKRCAVTNDFVERFHGGYAVESAEEFCEAVDKLIQDPEMAAKMGQNGRNHVAEAFNRDVVTRKYIRFFDTVISTIQSSNNSAVQLG